MQGLTIEAPKLAILLIEEEPVGARVPRRPPAHAGFERVGVDLGALSSVFGSQEVWAFLKMTVFIYTQ